MNQFIKRIVSLDNIHQWEERDSIVKESVSQHSFKVAAICAYLFEQIEGQTSADWKNKLSYVQFKCQCIEASLFHDLDEAFIMRDLPHPIKYNSFNGDCIRDSIDGFVTHEISGTVFQKLFELSKSKDVHTVVKYCDWVALYTFLQRNHALGADSYLEERELCKDRIKEFEIDVQILLSNKFNVEVELCNKFVLYE
jgi:5'-deoxynucleotidase YfbR-like HD superfamily hydrolase